MFNCVRQIVRIGILKLIRRPSHGRHCGKLQSSARKSIILINNKIDGVNANEEK